METIKKRNRLERKPAGPPLSALVEKAKRGRPTIAENWLHGFRDAWASLLEEAWLEIGWPLLSIRHKRNSTIEDVRKAFQPVKELPNNAGLAGPFYRESTWEATPAEVLKSRHQVGNLDAEIIKAQALRDEYLRSCMMAVQAVSGVSLDDKDKMQNESLRRLQRLFQLADDLRRFTTERDALNTKWLDQQAYVYRSEVLDFLHSGRYAVKPKILSKALAGLPNMGWRQSHLRCARMPTPEPRLHYQVLQIIQKINKNKKRIGPSKESVTELFRSEILKLPKKLGYTRDFLLEHWRDLRLAIEECYPTERHFLEFPYALTSTFMRNTRSQKNSVEQILSEQGTLSNKGLR